MSQHHIVLSDRNANSVWLPNSNQSAALSSQRWTRGASRAGLSRARSLFFSGWKRPCSPPRACLHLFLTHPSTSTTNSPSLLISVLSELSGSAAPSLSNFPHPSRTLFRLGIVMENQKWAGCLICSSFSTGWLWGARAHCVQFSILPSVPQTTKASERRF